MRFRVERDERLYGALRTELYLRCAQLPPVVMSEVLRNFAKLEGLIFWEGVKQGLAIAALDRMDDAPVENRVVPVVSGASAARAHALVYGAADTPLSVVETKTIEALHEEPLMREAAACHPWLSAEASEFAPQTLADAERMYGRGLAPGAPAKMVSAVSLQTREVQGYMPASAVPLGKPISDELPEEEVRAELDDRELDDLLANADAAIEDDATPESPAFLDRVRDELRRLTAAGWKPTSWAQMIMHLHLSMQVDASYLDLQLASEGGRTVLSQVGLFDIFPGLGVMVDADGSFASVKEQL